MVHEPTIYVVEDDPAVRQGLAELVSAIHLRVEAYSSAQGFLTGYDAARPGCVLLDIRLPGLSGLELLERLKNEKLHPPAIVVSARGDVPTVVRAMKAGALNFLKKPCREQELSAAIQEALQCDADNRRRVARRAEIQRRLSDLTEGECQVLRLLVEGNSNKLIAAALGLSVRTIEVRRAKLMQKMRAESLAELVRLALSADGFCGKRRRKSRRPR